MPPRHSAVPHARPPDTFNMTWQPQRLRDGARDPSPADLRPTAPLPPHRSPSPLRCVPEKPPAWRCHTRPPRPHRAPPPRAGLPTRRSPRAARRPTDSPAAARYPRRHRRRHTRRPSRRRRHHRRPPGGGTAIGGGGRPARAAPPPAGYRRGRRARLFGRAARLAAASWKKRRCGGVRVSLGGGGGVEREWGGRRGVKGAPPPEGGFAIYGPRRAEHPVQVSVVSRDGLGAPSRCRVGAQWHSFQHSRRDFPTVRAHASKCKDVQTIKPPPPRQQAPARPAPFCRARRHLHRTSTRRRTRACGITPLTRARTEVLHHNTLSCIIGQTVWAVFLCALTTIRCVDPPGERSGRADRARGILPRCPRGNTVLGSTACSQSAGRTAATWSVLVPSCQVRPRHATAASTSRGAPSLPSPPLTVALAAYRCRLATAGAPPAGAYPFCTDVLYLRSWHCRRHSHTRGLAAAPPRGLWPWARP